MLATLFPGEKPEYPAHGEAGGRRIELRLNRAPVWTTASCRYHDGEQESRASARVRTAELTDPVRTDSMCQQIIKLAMYRAVRRSGRAKPPWGALTGVRPGKLLTPLLKSGLKESEALCRFERDYDVSHERALLCLDASRSTLRADALLQPEDVCLYIGIPFCPTRCAYCSFVSQSTEKSMKLIPPFLEALHQELSAVAQQVRAFGLRVVSVYMGGGTPTTLSAAQLDELFRRLEGEYDLSSKPAGPTPSPKKSFSSCAGTVWTGSASTRRACRIPFWKPSAAGIPRRIFWMRFSRCVKSAALL